MSEENVLVFVAECDEWWKLKYNIVIQGLLNNGLEKNTIFLKSHLYKSGRRNKKKKIWTWIYLDKYIAKIAAK